MKLICADEETLGLVLGVPGAKGRIYQLAGSYELTIRSWTITFSPTPEDDALIRTLVADLDVTVKD